MAKKRRKSSRPVPALPNSYVAKIFPGAIPNDPEQSPRRRLQSLTSLLARERKQWRKYQHAAIQQAFDEFDGLNSTS